MCQQQRINIILFIVEGKTEIRALRKYISDLFDQADHRNEVVFLRLRENEKIKGGDITASRYINRFGHNEWVLPRNIEDAIYIKILAKYFIESNLKPEDISEIIQIVDTDGAFIPDSNIVPFQDNSTDQSPRYLKDKIECKDVNQMINRNRRKSDNLIYLSKISQIEICNHKIDYSVFYFSSNMEHALHSIPNIPNASKMRVATKYSRKYESSLDFAKDIIENKDKVVSKMDYPDSWKYIRKDNNSLRRHTNLGVLLEKKFADILGNQ